jgi:glucan phosphoethanolaminetransferase (alkaline phosphatase superfamily)
MEEKLTVKQVGLKYGIYLALVSIIYTLILQISGLAANQSLGYVGIIFMVVALILAHRDFKRSNEYMSYGQGLGIGMIIVSISSVLSSIFSYIYIKFVDSSMLDVIREQGMAQMEKRGMSDAQIEQAMEMQAKFTTPEMILIFGILGGIFFGFIVSLIITAFTKKTPPAMQ